MTGPDALPAILRLIGPDASAAAAWGSDEWHAIADDARQQRLRPLFHLRSQELGWTLPAELRDEWAKAYARATRRVLAQKVELARVTRWLAAAGIEAQVLKGGAILWRGWFDPAVRPMRDLDLLVAPEAASGAQQLLRSKGFTGAADTVKVNDKHLPGLVSPETGVAIEIHHRLIDAPTPELSRRDSLFRAAALAQAQTLSPAEGGFTVLCDAHTLLHLIVHAVLDHQFNNGPLLLIDIEALIERGRIDWNTFWSTADAIGATRAAQLALRLSESVWPQLAIEWRGHEPADLAPVAVVSAAHLMLVSPHTNTELGLLGRLARFDWTERTGIVLGGLLRRSGAVGLPRKGPAAGVGGSPLGRISQRIAALGGRQGRAQIKRSLDVAKWLKD